MGEPDHPPDGRGQLTASLAAGQAEVEGLKPELEAARHERDEYHLLLRQTRTEFARYRRQVEAEREEQARQARVELLVRVLPILDDFQITVAESADGDARPELIEGIERIQRSLMGVLESEGVERIEAVGAMFNPWEHEALQHQVSPELDDQRILAVVRDGYRLGDRVIRPAQVVVARRSSVRRK